MNELKIFENEEFGQIRTISIDGKAWLVGKDVATALGYTNSRKALADHVDEEDKGVTKCDTPGGRQELAVINESGMYSLIFSSKLDSAKRFKHWVTSEVLPALRKTGHYEMPGVGAYDAKATSVGEVVNLLQFTKKSMEKRGCGQKEIAEVAAEICCQFNIHMPKGFLASPDIPEKTAACGPEEETFEEHVEELKVAAWERKGRSMVTCRQFNDFCAEHGISARKFRRWLYQNGYIMASENQGKINYSLTIWTDGENKAERCVVFK